MISVIKEIIKIKFVLLNSKNNKKLVKKRNKNKINKKKWWDDGPRRGSGPCGALEPKGVVQPSWALKLGVSGSGFDHDPVWLALKQNKMKKNPRIGFHDCFLLPQKHDLCFFLSMKMKINSNSHGSSYPANQKKKKPFSLYILHSPHWNHSLFIRKKNYLWTNSKSKREVPTKMILYLG